MTKEEACQLPLGVYRIYWKSGEMSLAAVGQFYNGNRWLMPTFCVCCTGRQSGLMRKAGDHE